MLSGFGIRDWGFEKTRINESRIPDPESRPGARRRRGGRRARRPARSPQALRRKRFFASQSRIRGRKVGCSRGSRSSSRRWLRRVKILNSKELHMLKRLVASSAIAALAAIFLSASLHAEILEQVLV